MRNYPRIKWGLKKAMRAHRASCGTPKQPAGFNPATPWWGKWARVAAWRYTSHMTKAHGADLPVSQWCTQELVDHLFPPAFAKTIVKIALAEVGVKESPFGSNRGARVEEYQKTTGTIGQAWCASFVVWDIIAAAKRAGRKRPNLPDLPAYVPSWTAMIRRGDGWKQVPIREAKAGDVVTLWGSAHIEIVRYRSGDYLYCVGGNTSAVGQNSNGGMVAKTKRHVSEVTVVGRAR